MTTNDLIKLEEIALNFQEINYSRQYEPLTPMKEALRWNNLCDDAARILKMHKREGVKFFLRTLAFYNDKMERPI